MKPRSHFLFASFLAFAMTQASHAASGTWTGAGADSLWSNTANWSASPVPSGTDTATFSELFAPNTGKTTIDTTGNITAQFITFDTASAPSYTFGTQGNWNAPNGSILKVNSSVTANQNFNTWIRPSVGSTVTFDNDSTTSLLKLGTLYTQYTTSTTNAIYDFKPASGATIEVSGAIDNSNTGNNIVRLSDAGTLKISGEGNYDGGATATTDLVNSVEILQGTLMANKIINAHTSNRSSLGKNGRIQFGEAGQTRTATLDYYNATSTTTDRVFHIIDNNTAVFKVSGGASTNLELTAGITQSGSANGGGKLTKDGVGTLTLKSVSNGYAGATTVKQGKLVVDGNISTSVLTNVNDTATLGGIGTTGAVTILDGGTLAPGNSAGTLTVSGALTLNNLSKLAFELNPTDTTIGSGFNDLVTGVNGLTLDGLLSVAATSGSFASVTSGTWRLINYTGTLTNNTLDLFSMPDLASGYSWALDTSTAGQVNLTVIPEPRAALLGGIGLLLLLRRRRG